MDIIKTISGDRFIDDIDKNSSIRVCLVKHFDNKKCKPKILVYFGSNSDKESGSGYLIFNLERAKNLSVMIDKLIEENKIRG